MAGAEPLRDPAQEASLRQGVTTHVVGQDGFGFAPTTPRSFEYMRVFTSGVYGSQLPFGPASVAELLQRLDGAAAVDAVTVHPQFGRLTPLGPSPTLSQMTTPVRTWWAWRRERSGSVA